MNEKAQNLFPASALFLIVVCLLLPGIAEAGTSCTATSAYDDHLDANDDAANGDDGYCLSTPSSLVLKLYEFAICTAEPDPSDTSMCTKLFESAAGEDFDLSVGASLSMAENLSIEEGTYTYAYLKVSKDTKLKSTLDFSPNTRFDMDGREGKFCFTDGRSIQSTYSIIKCANTAAPSYSEETIRFSDNNTYNGTVPDYPAVVGSTTILTDLYMVDSDGDASERFADDFAIMGTQELGTAVTITPATTSLDVGFSVTNGMSFGFMKNGDSVDTGAEIITCNQAAGCLYDAVFDGIKFLVKAE
jgi:hypothetical protein